MSGAPSPVPAPDLTVAQLARAWAAAASRTTYVPMSGEEIEQLLTGLIDRLVSAVAAPQVDEQGSMRVAGALVEHHFIGPRTLGRSIEVLGDGLPRLDTLQAVSGLAAAVRKVLGALADGYAEALRQYIFNEQELVSQALLKAKRDAERGLRVSEARFREVFSASAVGIAISALGGALVEANQAFADLVGRPSQELVGVPLLELLHAKDDTELDECYRMLSTGELPRFRLRRRIADANGDIAWTLLAGSLLHDADGRPTHHITIVEDFTELYLLQQELSDQALHDRLTGLPNEHYFMSRLQEVLEAADPAALVTVCRVNLDSFSVINDGIGRTTGEQLLRSIAGRLRSLVAAERAMVARMGTDDFAILIENGPDTPDLGVLAASINDELAEPVYLSDRGLAVSAGVGVVRRPAGGISPGELIRAADATLHQVKRSGRGQWGLYDAQADAEERARYQLAAEMPGAFESGEISLEYQPVRSLQSGRLLALQALLRWDRTSGTSKGTVDHQECLSLAEQTGLVLALGRWMLHTACAELARWRAALPADLPLLRVDLTARLSEDPDLMAIVHDALSDTGARPEHMRVGVPLVALSRGRGDVMDNVHVLADLGAGVVLLGAATGPGYFAYLEDLPVTAVEIAPAMVTRLTERPGDDSVVARAVRHAIPLVHSVGATVIVPGIDTPARADWWRGATADAARGAHIGPAVAPDNLGDLLAHP
ncbi:MAG: putative bifunctional diguanylate cyclase/phosphodiesterase [Pseudonocardiaceae bacterium]